MKGIRSDRVLEELWTEVCDIVQEAVIKIIPKKRKCKKAKCLSEQDLKIPEKRREAKGKKERYSHLNAEFQRIARRDKKAFLSDQWKERKTIEWERLEISSKILEIPRNTSYKDGHNKEQKWYGHNRSRKYFKRWQEYTEELYKKGSS